MPVIKGRNTVMSGFNVQRSQTGLDAASKVSSKINLDVQRKEKLNADLKMRLQTSWRKIYRELLKFDEKRTGLISCPRFMQILHREDCFISREELMKLYKQFGDHTQDYDTNQTGVTQFEEVFENNSCHLKYKMLSKEMKLHQNYLEYIQNNKLDTESVTTLKTIKEAGKFKNLDSWINQKINSRKELPVNGAVPEPLILDNLKNLNGN